jgi:hypothetical protein
MVAITNRHGHGDRPIAMNDENAGIQSQSPAKGKQRAKKNGGTIAQRIGSRSRKPTTCRRILWYLKWLTIVGAAVSTVVVPIVLRRQNAEKEYYEGLKQSQKGNFVAAAQVRG